MVTGKLKTKQAHPFLTKEKAMLIRKRWDRQVAHALKYGKSYNTAKELMDDILR